jgi:hypothetical protein
MSMHKIPLTPTEEAGLRAHGLDIGTPSQLSDAFRQGLAWGKNAGAELCDRIFAAQDLRGNHAAANSAELCASEIRKL